MRRDLQVASEERLMGIKLMSRKGWMDIERFGNVQRASIYINTAVLSRERDRDVTNGVLGNDLDSRSGGDFLYGANSGHIPMP